MSTFLSLLYSRIRAVSLTTCWQLLGVVGMKHLPKLVACILIQCNVFIGKTLRSPVTTPTHPVVRCRITPSTSQDVRDHTHDMPDHIQDEPDHTQDVPGRAGSRLWSHPGRVGSHLWSHPGHPRTCGITPMTCRITSRVSQITLRSARSQRDSAWSRSI